MSLDYKIYKELGKSYLNDIKKGIKNLSCKTILPMTLASAIALYTYGNSKASLNQANIIAYSINALPPQDTTSYLGDCNGDFFITATDVMAAKDRVALKSVNYSAVIPGDANKGDTADINGDGFVTVTDYTALRDMASLKNYATPNLPWTLDTSNIPANVAVSSPIQVKLKNANNIGRPGIAVRFAVVSGPATLSGREYNPLDDGIRDHASPPEATQVLAITTSDFPTDIAGATESVIPNVLVPVQLNCTGVGAVNLSVDVLANTLKGIPAMSASPIVNCSVPLPACNDNTDNDGDTLVDMLDPGCSSLSDNDEYNAPLNQAPIAVAYSAFTFPSNEYHPTYIHPGNLVSFDAWSSYDPDCGCADFLTYVWSFFSKPGCSTLTNNDIVDRLTPTPYFGPDCVGDYTLELIVSDGLDTDSDTVVQHVADNNAPVADAGNDKIAGPGVPINPPFNASNSSDQDGVVVRYTWDFGDGDFYSESLTNATDGLFDGVANINKTYSSIGDYMVTVTVEDDDGSTNSDIAMAYIF